MHNRRALLLGTLLGLFSMKSQAAFANPTPTLKPTKVGQTIIFRGRKYTAIRQGKKLVWNKGVPIANPSASTSSQSPTPTASATPTPSATPTIKGTVIAKSSDLAVGETKKFNLKKGIFVTRTQSGLIAVDETCTHAGCAVEIAGKELLCPCHGSSFAFDGKVTGGVARRSLKSYVIEDLNGNIVIDLN